MKTRICRFFLVVLSLFVSPVFGQVAGDICSNRNQAIIPSTPSEDFIVHTDGTVTHIPTGLMWMRCSVGQTWDAEQGCTGTASTNFWQETLQAAEQVQFAGFSDWRLPNKNELYSIFEYACLSPAINSSIFPDAPRATYWTSSPFPQRDGVINDNAWQVSFVSGGMTCFGACQSTQRFAARLVRDGLAK